MLFPPSLLLSHPPDSDRSKIRPKGILSPFSSAFASACFIGYLFWQFISWFYYAKSLFFQNIWQYIHIPQPFHSSNRLRSLIDGKVSLPFPQTPYPMLLLSHPPVSTPAFSFSPSAAKFIPFYLPLPSHLRSFVPHSLRCSLRLCLPSSIHLPLNHFTFLLPSPLSFFTHPFFSLNTFFFFLCR